MTMSINHQRIKSAIVVLFASSWMISTNTTYAGCSIHSHNCLHGSYPNNPTQGAPPSGSASLTVGTGYAGAPDLNQHVSLPTNAGPFLASGPDGNPVTAAPLGAGPNVTFHHQQSVQYSMGSATATLNTAPGSERTELSGNVAQGTYGVAVHNYDLPGSGLPGSFNSGLVSGGTGHFDAPAQSHVSSPYSYGTGFGGILAPGEVATFSFNYYNNGFNPHATGVYVIPDGQWNLGGVPEPDQSTPGQSFLFEHANPNLTQDAVVNDFLKHILPLSSQTNREYGGLVFQNTNGGTGLSLTVGNEHDITIPVPDLINPKGVYHTHQDSDTLFSQHDLRVATTLDIDVYSINQNRVVGKVTSTRIAGYNDSSLILSTDYSGLDNIELRRVTGQVSTGINGGLKSSNGDEIFSGGNTATLPVGPSDLDSMQIGFDAAEVDFRNGNFEEVSKIPGIQSTTKHANNIKLGYKIRRSQLETRPDTRFGGKGYGGLGNYGAGGLAANGTAIGPSGFFGNDPPGSFSGGPAGVGVSGAGSVAANGTGIGPAGNIGNDPSGTYGGSASSTGGADSSAGPHGW
ncbi:MAG: DUF4329 domain-containing protein [Gammaproteobacteria bacterium]|nr:DUF4329 domain-containing protein [Gammaproteobacteria bacterium]